MASEQPLIVVVGPTASGKTSLSVELAKRYDGEIICADSRTVFREMNIGTAKPTHDEQQGVPHWGLDLTLPGERYTAAQFQAYANRAISDIRSRNKVPIIAGGTGLYVDGVIFDYDYPTEAPSEVRSELETMTAEQLHRYCLEHKLELPVNDKNKRHLIRTVLQGDAPSYRRQMVSSNTFVFGIATDRDELRTRIRARAEQMFKYEVVDEAKRLGDKYGWDSEAMTGNIYPLMRRLLSGEATESEAIEAFITRDWQLAKRQMTWFRRNPYIIWGTAGDIQLYAARLFNSE